MNVKMLVLVGLCTFTVSKSSYGQHVKAVKNSGRVEIKPKADVVKTMAEQLVKKALPQVMAMVKSG
ncbi:hypothetical protein KUH03_00345 [Sphingobacterium sp. E70]|uniref:hypothetical protein n=1 Tax=Sphingobacterium sp. E70 TaxID=2853439 RepID=UPI00211C769A|nr:hypothetical protein [Sphingobacterium sp. E70]ULT25510.1 hypothetical protein KUH03_00345 [Sphingobacterium sp. E70]